MCGRSEYHGAQIAIIGQETSNFRKLCRATDTRSSNIHFMTIANGLRHRKKNNDVLFTCTINVIHNEYVY